MSCRAEVSSDWTLKNADQSVEHFQSSSRSLGHALDVSVNNGGG